MGDKAGSLFTGVGGLDMAVAEVFGTELAWTCDNDPAATKVIAHRYPGMLNLGDITAVNWGQVEPVRLLTAGWPCQPWSTAGKRRGIEDERALWSEVARAIRTLRPGVVVLENVPAIVAAGELARACADLAACGYRFCWVVLGADEVGACHRRNRCFILAAADATSHGRHEGRPEPAGLVRRPDAAERGGEAPADTAGQGRRQRFAEVERDGRIEVRGGSAQPGGLDRAVADTDGAGLEGREPAAGRELPAGSSDWGVYTAAVERWAGVIGRPAPVPRVDGPRGGLKLNPALPEWMQGFPPGWITDVPGVSLNDALKLAGNSVNPYQAVAALRWLLAQLEEQAA
jgi:DNA (cytosine-5)-methyltransferase 1